MVIRTGILEPEVANDLTLLSMARLLRVANDPVVIREEQGKVRRLRDLEETIALLHTIVGRGGNG